MQPLLSRAPPPQPAPELLFNLLEINSSLPGLYLDYKNLANDLGADQRTMSNYLVQLFGEVD